jgi:mxaC protein
MPFTYDHSIIRDAIDGTRIGRGQPDTQLGRGLIAAIAQFDARPWTGHRAIVLVSDGGALLDAATRARIAEGLARNRVALYFIYLRSSVFSPELDRAARAADASPEAQLHGFFLTLKTPYRLFQAGDESAMTAAMNEINRQQNFPVSFIERLPRQDRSPWCYALALVCCVLVIVSRAIQVRSWV